MSFNEQAYLAANKDVADAVARGELKSGAEHYEKYGKSEGRGSGPAPDIDRLYAELEQGYQQTPEEAQQALWRSEGYGSREANQRAMAESLAKKGVYSLTDLRLQPRVIEEAGTFYVKADGSVVKVEDGGEVNRERPATAQEMAALREDPEYQKALAQVQNDRLGETTMASFEASVPTGQYTGSLINSRTGEVIDDNKDNSPLQQGFYIDKTSAGKGKTHFNLYPQMHRDEQGQVSGFSLLPGTEYRPTGFNKFMQDFGPMIGAAGLVLGLPGAAGTFGAGAGVASAALKGINALGAFNSGNTLGGIASLAGMVPGINYGFGLDMSPGTLSTAKTIGSAANFGQALQNKDYLGAISQMSGGLPGSISGVSTDRAMQGLGALGAAQRGDYLGATLGGLGAAGQTTLPGTDVDLRDAGSALNVYRAVDRGRPMDAFQEIVRSQRRRGPQDRVELAQGGRVPNLQEYMQQPMAGAQRGLSALGA
jgi:hypothetical protein